MKRGNNCHCIQCRKLVMKTENDSQWPPAICHRHVCWSCTLAENSRLTSSHVWCTVLCYADFARHRRKANCTFLWLSNAITSLSAAHTPGVGVGSWGYRRVDLCADRLMCIVGIVGFETTMNHATSLTVSRKAGSCRPKYRIYAISSVFYTAYIYFSCTRCKTNTLHKFVLTVHDILTLGHKHVSKVNVTGARPILASVFAFSALTVCIYRSAGCDIIAVICGMTVITRFDASTNQRHSTFSTPNFISRIPHFTHYNAWPCPRASGHVHRSRSCSNYIVQRYDRYLTHEDRRPYDVVIQSRLRANQLCP